MARRRGKRIAPIRHLMNAPRKFELKISGKLKPQWSEEAIKYITEAYNQVADEILGFNQRAREVLSTLGVPSGMWPNYLRVLEKAYKEASTGASAVEYSAEICRGIVRNGLDPETLRRALEELGLPGFDCELAMRAAERRGAAAATAPAAAGGGGPGVAP